MTHSEKRRTGGRDACDGGRLPSLTPSPKVASVGETGASAGERGKRAAELPIRPIPMAKPAKLVEPGIHILEKDDPPFQWRDLLTRKGLENNSGFLVSLVLHVLLLLFLSLLVVRGGIGDSTLFLDAAEAPADPDDELLGDLDVRQVAFENDMLVDENPLEALVEEAADNENADKDLLRTEPVNSELLGGPRSSPVRGDGKSASFFGTRASGRRFVFVVDRSTSMRNGSRDFVDPNELFNRYDLARSELHNAIESLHPHQEFFVVMFAHNTMPMFGRQSVEQSGQQEFQMIAATQENKNRFQQWLEEVPMGPGTDPRLALQIAISMSPDAIFMLSDGAFVSEHNDNRPKTDDMVARHASRGTLVPINTISLVVEETIPKMEGIARMSGGLFRFITIEEHAKQIASLRGPMRARALQKMLSEPEAGWEQRKTLILDSILPMLQDASVVERYHAQWLLHLATMGLFQDRVDSVFGRESNATTQWNEIVVEIDGYHRTGQVTALGRGREVEQRVLLSMLEPNDDSVVRLFDRLDVEQLKPLTWIEMVRSIQRAHEKFGTSPETVRWLRELIARLSGKKPKERSEAAKARLVQWDSEAARQAISRLFEERSKRAQALFRKYNNPEKGRGIRERLGKSIVRKYPETNQASRVRSDFARQLAAELSSDESREPPALDGLFDGF